MTDDEIRAIWNRTQDPVALARAVLAAAPLPAEQQEPTAYRVWAKGGKFTRGLYESIDSTAREIHALDGDTIQPLYATPPAAGRELLQMALDALTQAVCDINSMKIEAETAAMICGDESVTEHCETISSDGLAASMKARATVSALRAALSEGATQQPGEAA